MVAVEAEPTKSDKYENYTVSASSWIVFESKGPVWPTLSDTWKRIYGEFMPSSSYKQNPDIPTIEKYFSNDTMAEDYYVEIWIPIIKK